MQFHPQYSSQRRSRSITALIFLILFNASASLGAQLPKKLMLLSGGPAGTTIYLENVVYTTIPAAAGVPVKGTGDLRVSIAGMELPAQASLPFGAPYGPDIVADESGQITGGGIRLREDVPFTDALSTGVDLVFKKDSQFTVVAKGVSARMTGVMTAKLPFKSETGEPAIATAPTVAGLNANGDFQLNVTNATLSGGTAATGIKLFGFTFRAGTLDVGVNKVTGAPKPVTFTCMLKNVSITTPIPNLLTREQAPLVLKATQVGLDENGAPTFGDATLASQVAPYRIAGLQTPGPPTQRAIPRMKLMRPLDFMLDITRVHSCSVTSGQFTSLKFAGNLTLPSFLDDGNGRPVVINDLQFDALAPSVTAGPGTQKTLVVEWNDFRLNVTSFGMDLNRGLTNVSATMDLPKAFRMGRDPNSPPVRVAVTGFSIGGDGVSGEISITPDRLGPDQKYIAGFPIQNLSGSLAFDRGRLLRANIGGQMTVRLLSGGVTLNVACGISTNGAASIDVRPTGGIPFSALGMSLSITGGSLTVANGRSTLLLSGALTFDKAVLPRLDGATLAFSDMGIDPEGKVTGAITLARPVSIDLEVCKINIEKCTFDLAKNMLQLDGGARLDPSLPVKAEVDFYGATITAGLKGPQFNLNGLRVKAGVMGFATVEGMLRWDEKGFNGFTNCMYGDALLSLDFLGPSAPGIAVQFLIADKGAWFVAGDINLPSPIVLPPPPPFGPVFSIYAFRGGIGHNCRLQATTGQSPKDLRAYYFDNGGGKGQWLAQAGMTLGTVDMFSFWGDLVLTVGAPPHFYVNLNGQMAIMELYSFAHKPFNQMDRYGSLNINWDSKTSTLQATANVNLYFPTKSANLMYAGGGMDLLLSPDEGHLFIGWPYRGDGKRPITVTSLGGTPLAVTGEGGAGVMIWHPSRERWVKAGMRASKQLGPINGEIGGDASFVFNDRTKSAVFSVSAYAEGSVDLWVGHASGRANLGGALGVNPDVFWLKGELKLCVGCFAGDVCVTTGEVKVP